jgi:3-hydroxyacyl-CoA dehydrogenase/enoyl-CoA hydratase/3-hydroxybutyryl-CoA epimerase
VLRYMNESYNMLAEGVPPAMIENAAKMAGMPVGPLALNDEVGHRSFAEDRPRHDRRPGRKGRRSRAIWSSSKRMVEKEGRWDARTARASMTIRRSPPRSICGRELKTLYPQQDPAKVDVKELQNRYLAAIALEAVRGPWRKASSPIRAKPISAPSSASASRPTRAVR